MGIPGMISVSGSTWHQPERITALDGTHVTDAVGLFEGPGIAQLKCSQTAYSHMAFPSDRERLAAGTLRRSVGIVELEAGVGQGVPMVVSIIGMVIQSDAFHFRFQSSSASSFMPYCRPEQPPPEIMRRRPTTGDSEPRMKRWTAFTAAGVRLIMIVLRKVDAPPPQGLCHRGIKAMIHRING